MWTTHLRYSRNNLQTSATTKSWNLSMYTRFAGFCDDIEVVSEEM